MPVFISQRVRNREILWVWKRKVIRQSTLRELVGAFAFVELFFNGLAQFHIINDAQDEIGFGDFAKLFERLIQGVLPRIGVEPPEQLGGGRFLQFDGGNEAEHLVPLRFNEGLFDIPIGEELVALLFVFTPFAKPIQLLVFELTFRTPSDADLRIFPGAL